jgi:hypothetical protein
LAKLAGCSIGGLAENAFEVTFVEKEPAESTEVVQDAAACGHVAIQFGEIEVNQLESLFAAARTVSACQRDV